MEVIQVKTIDGIKFVEVLDTTYLDRQFRVVWRDVDIQPGDRLHWQSLQGLLTRGEEFKDKKIGRCEPSDALVVRAGFADQYEERFGPSE